MLDRDFNFIPDFYIERQPGPYFEGRLALFLRFGKRWSVACFRLGTQGILSKKKEVTLVDFNDYWQVRSHLFVDVVSTKRNQEMLKDAPHTKFEDLSMVYRIWVPADGDSFGSVLVSNSMMDRFGADNEQLHRGALENAPQIRPVTVKSMGSILGMLGAPPGEDSTLLVLTTEDMFKGAVGLFYPDMMQSCSRMLKQDYFILPLLCTRCFCFQKRPIAGCGVCNRWSRRSWSYWLVSWRRKAKSGNV